MIAFLDAEYNCCNNGNIDNSIIDVSLLIVNECKSFEVIDSFQSYVKPKMNSGKLDSYIKRLTGISQQTIDTKGKSLKEVVEMLNDLLIKYKVSQIYVYGDNDPAAFKWNAETYNIKALNIISNKFCNISKKLTNKLGIKGRVSLEHLALICNVDTSNMHNSMTDTIILYEVFKRITYKKYNKDRVKMFEKYFKLRDSYDKLCGFIKSIESCEMDPKMFLNMAIDGKKFVNINDFLSKCNMNQNTQCNKEEI